MLFVGDFPSIKNNISLENNINLKNIRGDNFNLNFVINCP